MFEVIENVACTVCGCVCDDLRVTVDAVAGHLAGIAKGEIRRYELPPLSALQFVCEHCLAGGVTTSLALDAHGKSLSYALLEMEI